MKENEQGHQYFSKKKPFKPNHSEVFGLMREYGPAQGLAEGSFDPEEFEDDEEE